MFCGNGDGRSLSANGVFMECVVVLSVLFKIKKKVLEVKEKKDYGVMIHIVCTPLYQIIDPLTSIPRTHHWLVRRKNERMNEQSVWRIERDSVLRNG